MGSCLRCLSSSEPETSKKTPLLTDEENKKQPETSIDKQMGSNGIGLDSFQIEKVLGKGAFGKVFLATKKDSGNVYAMKSLKKEMIEKRNQRVHTKTEREILEGVDSPFIVQLRYAFQTPDRLYMIMDFVNGGELFFHLRRSTRFTEERTRFYAAEIFLALDYLHSIGVIYRDLKPENVLVDVEGHIKLTDFGLSKKFFAGDRNEKTFSFCGTPEYLAPEILKGVGHDKGVDYWSLGALIYEMLAGAPPFYSRSRDEMFRNMLSKPVQMKSHFSNKAIGLLRNLLVVDPKKRFSSSNEIKNHPFFEGIDWELLLQKKAEPPFKPQVSSAKDLRYFDKMFTDEKPEESMVNGFANSQQRAANNYENFTYQQPSHLF